MRARPRSRSGHEPGVKVDARSERWREHRKKVRAEIVDAAFRAIDRLGPELSLREIAEEAGTAKPKIYRHFTDKSDLFQAIGERMRDMLWSISTRTSCGSSCRAGSPINRRPRWRR
jgi:AcrR family transcriptional regulator